MIRAILHISMSLLLTNCFLHKGHPEQQIRSGRNLRMMAEAMRETPRHIEATTSVGMRVVRGRESRWNDPTVLVWRALRKPWQGLYLIFWQTWL